MLVVVLVGLGAVVALAGLWPAETAALAAKEGPLEAVGHVLLVLALGGWLAAAWRARGRERRLCAALALTCAVTLGEELDWGGVYGFSPLADVVRGVTGRGNFHNAWHGASYVLFALPVVLLVGVVGWRRGAAPGRLPRRRDALGLALLAAASLVGSLAWPAWEPELDELIETLLYAGLVVIALRPVGSASGSSTSA